MGSSPAARDHDGAPPDGDVANGHRLARAGAARTAQLLAALRRLDGDELDAPSTLPGWSRRTIVCHLRYRSHALLRMTRDVLSGCETSFYPGGRGRVRAATLEPAPGERAVDVLDDWEATAAALDDAWAGLDDADWARRIVEPADNQDLGPVPLARLALARLTEVDVHGTDLDIGFPDWSPVLVEVGLPTRLRWLVDRRTNHRPVDASVEGDWLLDAGEGRRWLVSVHGDDVAVRPATEADEPDAVVRGSARDLLALLLGRPTRAPLEHLGDVDLAADFPKAFPGP
jgi:uncharacterized protein (TIGR03083 family)